jgi:hypothetical protein
MYLWCYKNCELLQTFDDAWTLNPLIRMRALQINKQSIEQKKKKKGVQHDAPQKILVLLSYISYFFGWCHCAKLMDR